MRFLCRNSGETGHERKNREKDMANEAAGNEYAAYSTCVQDTGERSTGNPGQSAE